MKAINFLLFTLIFCFSSCTMWEEKWTQVNDLPRTDDLIEVDPWESEEEKRGIILSLN